MESIVVIRIYEEYSNGKTISEIIKKLQEKQIPSPNNSNNNGETRYKWTEETIRRILSNKVYLGHTEYGKRVSLSYKSKKVKYIHPDEWKICYNTHEAIITEELFNKVQNRKNINKTIKRKKHKWLLNGIVKCKECGSKMTLKVEYNRNNKKELKSKKICCLNGLKKYKGQDCIKGSKGLDEEILNKIILRNLKEIIQTIVNKNKIKTLIIKYNDEIKSKYNTNNKEFLNKELIKIENEMKILYQDYKEDLLDEYDYKKFYKEKSIEKKRIKTQIELLQNEEEKENVIVENKLDELVDNIFQMVEINIDIVSEIIYDIQIDKDNQIYINYRYNIFEAVA